MGFGRRVSHKVSSEFIAGRLQVASYMVQNVDGVAVSFTSSVAHQLYYNAQFEYIFDGLRGFVPQPLTHPTIMFWHLRNHIKYLNNDSQIIF